MKKFKLTFASGNYDHAILCYMEAKRWVLSTGLWNHPLVEGIIQHPDHAESPAGEFTVPTDLVDAEGWSITVTITCKHPAAEEFLKSLKLPSNSQLTEEHENHEANAI